MATIKSYTNLEQSKKLAEILPLESADMSYSFNFNSRIHEISTTSYKSWVVPKYAQPDDGFGKLIPCWSLAALLGVLPKEKMLVNTADNKYYCFSNNYMTGHYDNPLDTCVEMIIKLNEAKIL